MDVRAAMAREAHREAERLSASGAQQRASRDRLVRELRAEDPQRWTYGRLAAEIGCSRELIAHICRTGE